MRALRQSESLKVPIHTRILQKSSIIAMKAKVEFARATDSRAITREFLKRSELVQGQTPKRQ